MDGGGDAVLSDKVAVGQLDLALLTTDDSLATPPAGVQVNSILSVEVSRGVVEGRFREAGGLETGQSGTEGRLV